MSITVSRNSLASLLAGLALTACLSPVPAPAQTPELPRRYVDTRFVQPTGKTLAVSAGGDLQAALDAAQPGDVIELAAGAVYSGPFVLPAKSGAGWIILRSSSAYLRPLGTPVTPVDARFMAKLEASSGPVLSTAPGAHHYRLVGLEIRPGGASGTTLHRVLRWLRPSAQSAGTGTFLENLVLLGSGDTSTDTLPHHIIFDRCYIHGDPVVGARRGIAMNSSYTAVIDSYLSDFKEVGEDSQAIASWNGPGPFKIADDYLEAAGENLMFGGEDPSIRNLVPSDIEISGNHFAKPLSWKAGEPSYQGTAWTVKNLLELKNATRVLIRGNLLEYNWPQAQNGFAILFTVRDQDGTAPWSVVEDVSFVDNTVRHVASGVNILGYDDNQPSQQTQRILIRNNLFYDVGGSWGGGTWLQLVDGAADVAIEHDTALQTATLLLADGRPDPGFVYTDNIAPHNAYGIIGTGTGIGLPTLASYLPGSMLRRDVLVGGLAGLYPPGNFFPAAYGDVGFVDFTGGDYRLRSSSPYRNMATDGGDIGADFDELCAALKATGQALADSIPACTRVLR